jgi:hypothetical protein
MKKQIQLFAFAVITSMLLNSLPCKATVLRVNNNPNYTQGCSFCYNNLQTAINSAANNDTIHLEASGTNYGNITIDKPLTIIGTGYFLSQNLSLQKNQNASQVLDLIFSPLASGSRISGVSIMEHINIGNASNATYSNITISNCYISQYISFLGANNVYNNIHIKKNYFDNNNGNNITTISTQTGNNLVVANNNFLSSVTILQGFTGIVSNNVFNATLTNRIVTFYGGIDFFNNILQNQDVVSNNNSATNTYNNVFYNQPAWLSGGNNYFSINMAFVFGTSSSTDGNLAPLVTCINCATGGYNGEQIGVFGGADPYKLSGIPNIPTIYQLQSPLNVIQGTPTNVNISTRSNN